MQISTRGKNAIKFMLDLANHNDGKPVSLKDVANRQDISVKYLEQIVILLQRASMLQSMKGNHGGYMLKYPPEKYTMFQILKATENSLFAVAGDYNDPYRNHCVICQVWKRLDSAIYDTLENITLADLMDWQEEMTTAGNYCI